MQDPHFSCDLSSHSSLLPHFWEHTVGSGHASLALRADYQQQLKRCSRELGFQHVRFHGILSDEMGTLVIENDQLIYSFHNADLICDFLLSIGMKPFMELSFMPTAIASGNDTVFHYKSNITPPKDYKSWKSLIHELIQHWHDRYGADEIKKWFFEVWNEPNLKAFWTGTKADYFKLYDCTAEAIKGVHPELKVGGPATAVNEWIKEFQEHCQTKDSPLDFISTHHYPTDAFGKPGDDTLTQLSDSHRSVLREEAKKVVTQAKGKPVYYTEWCTSSNPFDDLHDQPYAASFIVKTVLEAQGLVQGYSYWTFSDIFEENYFSSVPFHGGFGLMTVHGIPKPAYRAYQLLHELGDKIYKTHGDHATVDAWVTKRNSSIVCIATNSQLPRHPVKTETVVIEFKNIEEPKNAFIKRIDETHANSFQHWNQMGKPSYLNKNEVNALEQASALIQEPIAWEKKADSIRFTFQIPPQGTVSLIFEQ